jgi:hypothetical protein
VVAACGSVSARSAVPLLAQSFGAVVTIGSPTEAVPADLLGFNLETSGLCNVLALDASRGSAYEQLYRNLGPGVLHLGGDSVDSSIWDAPGTPSCSPTGTVLTQAETTSLFAFARRIGWRVLWGLPLATFNPAADAEEAAAVAAIGGQTLLGWTIGNEPDLYVSSGVRPASWTFADYLSQWTQTRDAVTAAAPGVPVIGPDTCCDDQFFPSFAAAAGSEVSALSLHYYTPAGGPLTADYLLSAAAAQGFASLVSANWRAAESDAVPLYISESNSFSGGGVAGVSNTFASSLWVAQLLFQAASLHVSQVDIQETGTDDPYNAIDPSGNPRPLYYGMLLFHSAAGSGGRLLDTEVTTTLDVAAYAVQAPDGSVTVVLVNDTGASVTVRIDNPGVPKSASRYRLTAPGIASTSEVTLGNHSVSAAGTWAPTLTRMAVTGASLAVTLPAYTVTCIDQSGIGS